MNARDGVEGGGDGFFSISDNTDQSLLFKVHRDLNDHLKNPVFSDDKCNPPYLTTLL